MSTWRKLQDSYGFAGNPTLGFRTPTEVTVPLKKGALALRGVWV